MPSRARPAARSSISRHSTRWSSSKKAVPRRGKRSPAATTRILASIDERHDPPAHVALIARVGLAETLHERPLFEWYGGEKIRRGDDRERCPVSGHVRGAERRQYPPQIERMPDQPIRPANLQCGPLRWRTDACQLERIDRGDRSRDQPDAS